MLTGKDGKILAYMLSESTTVSDFNITRSNDSCVDIDTVLIDTSKWNRNGRKYPTPVVKRAADHERIQEQLKTGSWCGEAGHPLQPTVQRQAEVMKDNISHRILSIDWKGPVMKGHVQTAPTDRGREMRDFILSDPPMIVAFSLRGLGPVMQTKEGYIVKDPLTLITFDWVFYPSYKEAYQQSIIAQKVQESVQLSGNDMYNSSMIALSESSALNYAKEESKNFKLVAPLFEANNQILTLSNDNRKIILTNLNEDSKDTIIIPIEKYISNEIDNYSLF